MMVIKAQKVSRKKFQKFGKLATNPVGQPTSEGVDYKFWSDLASYQIEGETEIGICRVFRQEQNLIKGMERHLHTPEILIPIDAPFAVPLLLGDASEKEAMAFRVDLGQAIVIDPAVWHGACLPVGKKESSYFVIFRRKTPFTDVEKKEIIPFEIKI